MSRTSLETLVRLRRLAGEDARRAFAACLRAEDETAAALRSAESAILHEQAAAADLAADDTVVEAFAAWLPQGRQAVARASAAHDRAGAATAQARAAVAAARVSTEVAERLMQAQAAARADEAARRSQISIDEAAARRPRGP
jgi:flagellar biosynthesis chaperone FliJ